MADRQNEIVSLIRAIRDNIGSGGGGGGNSNLMIGTQAERLAYTGMVDGTEWNEVGTDPEGNTLITKYVYIDGAWVAEEASESIITIVFKLYDEQLVDVTDQDTDLPGKTITYTIDGTETKTTTILDNHTAFCEIPFGAHYKINDFSNITYNYYVHRTDALEDIALHPTITINVALYAALHPGVYGMDASGRVWSVEEIKNMATLEERQALGITYVLFTNSEMVHPCFYVLGATAQSGKAWATENVLFDETLLPQCNNQTKAETYNLDGKLNTTYIFQARDEINEGRDPDATQLDTPAANWCADASANITIGGIPYTGFLPSWVELKGAKNAQTAENGINELYTALGMTNNINFGSGYWWTSVQSSGTAAVLLGTGSFLSNANKNATSYSTFRFYAL